MRNPKHRLFEQIADLARSFGNAHRLELLECLAQGERTVEGLAERSGMPVANASQHLQQLRRSGLVASRRNGRHIIYSLADGAAIEILSGLRRVAERNIAEVREIVAASFDALDTLEPVSRAELKRRLRDDSVLVIDVRPRDEFDAGHLPGAVNVPLSELDARLLNLPAGREIVAYCRGPYCILAFEAVALLRARGFHVRRLEDGFPEWKAAGLKVEAA